MRAVRELSQTAAVYFSSRIFQRLQQRRTAYPAYVYRRSKGQHDTNSATMHKIDAPRHALHEECIHHLNWGKLLSISRIITMGSRTFQAWRPSSAVRSATVEASVSH